MSQQVNTINKGEVSDDSISAKKAAAMASAQDIGYVLVIFGWFLFGLGVASFLFLLCFFNDYDWGSQFAGFLFALAGFSLVPGWFLLRFADGLFPFSRQIFKAEFEKS